MAGGDPDSNSHVCDYVARKSDPETWHGDSENEWFLDRKRENGGLDRDEWRCPHPPMETDEGTADRCVFHAEDPDGVDWGEAIRDGLDHAGESPYPDGPEHRGQFVGATIGAVDLSGERIVADGHDIRFDHAVFDGRGGDIEFKDTEFVTKGSGSIFGVRSTFVTEGEGDVRFENSMFQTLGDGDLGFYMATFQTSGDGDVWFENATFRTDGEGDVWFDNATFRTDGDGDVWFDNATFRTDGEGTIWFGEARFQTDSDGYIWFDDAKFQTRDEGDVRFDDAKFQTDGDGDVWFDNTRFQTNDEGHVWFVETKFQTDGFGDIRFREARFQTNGDGDVRFWGTQFRTTAGGNIWFDQAQFWTKAGGDVRFDSVVFYPCHYGKTSFNNVYFQTNSEGRVVFQGAWFATEDKGELQFTNATLTNGEFPDVTFGAADFSGADLRGISIDYTELATIQIDEGTTFGGRSQWEVQADECARDSIPGRSAALAILPGWLSKPLTRALRCLGRWRTDPEPLGKAARQYRATQRALRENNLRELRDLEIREQHALRKQALAEGKWGTWLVRAFKRWPLGYGEQAWKVVATALLVIVGGTVLYPVWGLENSSDGPSQISYAALESGIQSLPVVLGKSAYFSTLTFTTVNYGDLQPIGWAQTVATVESFLGALLMAYLVFVLGRRVTW